MSPRTTGRAESGGLRVTGGDGVYVVHGPGPLPEHLAASAREMLGAPVAGRATVLVGAGFADPDALCDGLAPALDACEASGVTQIRLVMTGGATELPGRPAPARRLTERWRFDVVAPAGAAMVVPGGGLFAPDVPGTPGAWWHFSPGMLPRRLGARHPQPGWQAALDRVAADTAEGCVVQHIPAGLMVLPAGGLAEGADAVRYALPADSAHPVILVGAPGSVPVPADALADVVAALPASVRGTVRLLPGDGRDLLPAAQQAADLLGTELRVASGVTVLLDDAAPKPGGSPWDQPARNPAGRTVLLDEYGNPSWRPYVEAVTCVPAGTRPRLADWRAPIGGLRPGVEPGTLLLDRRWQVAVTRAGLWVGPSDARVPESAALRPVEPDVMAVDLGHPDLSLDDATLWAPLQRLFGALQDDVRDRTMIQLHGEASPATHRAVRRLAVQYGLAVAARGWRPLLLDTAPGPAQSSAAPGVAVPPAPVRSVAASGTAAPGAPGQGASAAPVTGLPAQGEPTPVRPATASSADAARQGTAAATDADRDAATAPGRAALRMVSPAEGPAVASGPTTSSSGRAPVGAASEGVRSAGSPAEGVPSTEALPTSVPARDVAAKVGAATRDGGANRGAGGRPGATASDGSPSAEAAPTRPRLRGFPGLSSGGANRGGSAGAPATASPPDGPSPAEGGAASGIAIAGQAPGGFGPGRSPATGMWQDGTTSPAPAVPGAPGPGTPWTAAPGAPGAAPGVGADASTAPGVTRHPAAGPMDETSGRAAVRAVAAGASQPSSPEPGTSAFSAGPGPDRAEAAAEEHVLTPARGTGSPEHESGHLPDEPPVLPPLRLVTEGGTAGTPPVAPPLTLPQLPVGASPSGAAQAPGSTETSVTAPAPSTPEEPATARSPRAPEAPGTAGSSAVAEAPVRPAAPVPPAAPGTPGTPVIAGRVPVLPSRRSTAAERDLIRALLGAAWDGHSAAVTRAMTQVPALRGGSAAESEDATAELALLHAYMHAEPGAPWSYEGLRAAAVTGDRALVPVLACVAAALRRLPSYRGAVVRPAGSPGIAETARLLLPGEELGDVLPVSGLAVERGGPAVAGDRYLAWSMTGRRAGSLLGGPGAEAAGPGTADEVLFAPGTRLRLLAVDDLDGTAVVLLRELPESAPAAVPGVLDTADEIALDRLRSRALPEGTAAASISPARMPGRCTGVLGLLNPGPGPGG